MRLRITVAMAVLIASQPFAAANSIQPTNDELLAVIKRLEARIASLEKQQPNAQKLESSQQRRNTTDRAADAYARAYPNPVYKVAPVATPAATASWNNFYAGVSLGAGAMPLFANFFTQRSDSTYRLSADANNSIGLLSDFFMGWNKQLGSSFVVGLQLEGSLSSIRNQHTVAGTYSSTTSNYNTLAIYKTPTTLDWMASALVRAGWLPNQKNLIYVAGGWSYASMFNRWLDDSFYLNGPTAAVGWETRLGTNWSFRTEYRYAHFPTEHFSTVYFDRTPSQATDTIFANSANANLHVVKVGFSYLTD